MEANRVCLTFATQAIRVWVYDEDQRAGGQVMALS